MVASSSAMSQSIVSSIIVRLRRIAGIVACRAENKEGPPSRPPPPPASSNNGARSPNAPPRSKAAGRRAIGKPTSCCSPDATRDCWFSTNDKPASASFSTRSIEKPSSPPGPSPVNSVNFHRRYAKPSASTTETSSPSITGFTKPSASKPSSAIPIVLGKKAALKTPSGYYDAHCHAKLTSSSSRQPPSSGTFSASTTPHANAWTSRHPPRHSPNSNQSLHFKRDSISLLSQGRHTATPAHSIPASRILPQADERRRRRSPRIRAAAGSLLARRRSRAAAAGPPEVRRWQRRERDRPPRASAKRGIQA